MCLSSLSGDIQRCCASVCTRVYVGQSEILTSKDTVLLLYNHVSFLEDDGELF